MIVKAKTILITERLYLSIITHKTDSKWSFLIYWMCHNNKEKNCLYLEAMEEILFCIVNFFNHFQFSVNFDVFFIIPDDFTQHCTYALAL